LIDKQKTLYRKHCVTDPVGTEAGIQVDLWQGIPSTGHSGYVCEARQGNHFSKT